MATLFQRLRRSRWLGWLIDNPILVREVRRRMRGRLFSWSLIGYLGALGVVSALTVFSFYPKQFEEMSTRDLIQQVGRIGLALFIGMCVVESIIAVLIAPLLTAGLATQEKEKDTFDFLRVTTLHSRTFVAGCLLTTASFLLLVFSCTLPILALTFIFGGVSLREIFIFHMILFTVGMTFSAWNVYHSTSFRRAKAQWAAVVIPILLLIFVGPGLISMLFRSSFIGFSPGGPFGASFPWITLCYIIGPLLLIITILAIAAARRLYDPNNRLFSYRQFTIFFLLLMGAIAGSLTWHKLFPAGPPLSQDGVSAYLISYFFTGAFLVMIAFLLFSAGHVDKGDEVWQFRLRHPYFQKHDERTLLYLSYIIAWIIPTYLMGLLWDTSHHFLPNFWMSLYYVAASILLVWALVNLLTALTFTRNAATLLTFLVLLFVWGVLPCLGLVLREITFTPGRDNSAEMIMVANILSDCSPFPILFRIWTGQVDNNFLRPGILTTALAVVAYLPLLSKGIARRLSVSYEWNSAPARKAQQPLSPAEAAARVS